MIRFFTLLFHLMGQKQKLSLVCKNEKGGRRYVSGIHADRGSFVGDLTVHSNFSLPSTESRNSDRFWDPKNCQFGLMIKQNSCTAYLHISKTRLTYDGIHLKPGFLWTRHITFSPCLLPPKHSSRLIPLWYIHPHTYDSNMFPVIADWYSVWVMCMRNNCKNVDL